MDHHEQHHQHHEKEREQRKKEQKEYEREHEREDSALPFHPAWLVAVGGVLVLAAVLIWTLLI
jgi:hypothetical protein